ncbi:synaptobrevin [Aspergillus nomiae NRRL 13137]|uniref:Synaptobrevin n=1 Tax=Aspergillus nomiae NRRL (strain ATCC 15546 / NRRL 13137 / CBS 260.88 / M93) TaxID=1509407 RepID=A0A0L1IQC6_ASPN3|nr:synaptobrevin [Aspergillus nomiae NRRL 13137]KNG81555.1 synaptobrevin [Aspergillus nomiae NRRL 13137]
MTITTYPGALTSDPNLANLSLSRLLARLEHNLLSSSADLKPLRRSEYQRMRVGANIEYARATLQELERSLPQIKPVDRRHEIQSDITRDRQTLKRLQSVLDQLNAEAEMKLSAKDGQGLPDAEGIYEDEDEESVDGEDLLGTPEEGSTPDEGREIDTLGEETAAQEETKTIPGQISESLSHEMAAPTATSDATATATTASPTPTSTLRNRHNGPTDLPATATGSSLHEYNTAQQSSSSTAKIQSTEETLDTHRREQEDITNSLLSLATQLKSSSQAFQSSLESEKSVLARAVEGLDRTTGNMEAAERRMGMLRRMTEGKGWWGRMMLYAWIFGLWVVAVLIVFIGPKLRF